MYLSKIVEDQYSLTPPKKEKCYSSGAFWDEKCADEWYWYWNSCLEKNKMLESVCLVPT